MTCNLAMNLYGVCLTGRGQHRGRPEIDIFQDGLDAVLPAYIFTCRSKCLAMGFTTRILP